MREDDRELFDKLGREKIHLKCNYRLRLRLKIKDYIELDDG